MQWVGYFNSWKGVGGLVSGVELVAVVVTVLLMETATNTSCLVVVMMHLDIRNQEAALSSKLEERNFTYRARAGRASV